VPRQAPLQPGQSLYTTARIPSTTVHPTQASCKRHISKQALHHVDFVRTTLVTLEMQSPSFVTSDASNCMATMLGRPATPRVKP
jgi:hypothetical protein